MKISLLEKIGYGLGDTAGNFVYTSVLLLLSYFYTEVYGLDPATVASIFLFVRIFDAITDPLMGLLCERTKTRWGKYRPYLIWLCVPYAIASVLVFTVPELEGTDKVIYAYVTYSLLMILFTAINIPFGAMTGVMTNDPQERTSLNSIRFMFAALGGLIVSSLVLPMTTLWDDPKVGYQYAMMIMATASVVLYVICFLTTKERVVPVKNTDSQSSMVVNITQVFKNDQFRWIALITLVMVSVQTFKNTSQLYYINSVVENGTAWSAMFLIIVTLGGICGAPLAGKLVKLMDKKQAWIVLHYILAVFSLVSYFIDQSIILVLTIQFFIGFFTALIAPIWFTFIADTVDYGELKFKQRFDALSLSFTIFALKLGLSIGGAACLYLLGMYGYQSGGVEQSAQAIDGINKIFSVIPAVGYLFTALLIRQTLALDSKSIAENADQLTTLRSDNSQ